MIAALDKLRKGVSLLQRLVRKDKANQINSSKTRKKIGAFVRSYFEDIRKICLETLGEEINLTALDSLAQDLLRCTQHRTKKTVYIAIFRRMSQVLSELEIISVTQLTSLPNFKLDATQQIILETLHKVSPSAKASYEQGLYDLAGPDRMSWRGPALDFREALRETLDSMAPDDAVTGQPGFKLEPDTKGPTMKQKVSFILRSRRQKDNQIKPFSEAIDIVEELIGRFVRSVYSRSSLAVHVQVSREEVRKIRDYVSLILKELLEIKV